ncbi:MAG: RNA polymerase sigma factor RpoE [Gammaproteobacteria bacterium]|nr:RNA polymerase sigma factor RpoE [Gammaproteobacteria bacterium]NND45859.1 RNA polymerase sigma factor RpoE [Xanthomonadales bacterium]NNL99243.1 RNA polymerase sigma factor RpoE [Gammaproteobacteria bacterium]
MSDRSTDQALVERVQRGDSRAFDLLVQKYQTRIVKLVSRYVREPNDALDIAQEAFLKAYRALPNFRGDSAFYTWLYRIAINTAKNYLVSLSRRPMEVDLDRGDGDNYDIETIQHDVATPERLLATEQIREQILQALDELPDDLRTAITLREMDGMSYEDIAVTMGCPIGTVRSRIFRAREAIDERVRPLMEN